MVERSLIDCHVHLAALPEGQNGCYISPHMLKSPLFRFLLWKHGLSPHNPRQANRKYVDDLLTELRASKHVRQAVLLGMDGVYDHNGQLAKEETHFLISNEYVLATARAHPDDFLPGVSVNPQRRDAVDEVHRCADAGAVLVKVLPNAQQFNPADAKYRRFYRALAERRLPFLSHVGYEFSLIGKDQSVGDPTRLEIALDEGVTVIAAHACSYGLMLYERFLPVLLDFSKRYPNFYADISALTLPNRCRSCMWLPGDVWHSVRLPNSSAPPIDSTGSMRCAQRLASRSHPLRPCWRNGRSHRSGPAADSPDSATSKVTPF